MASRTRPATYQEGPEAAHGFKNALGSILRVSKHELEKREAAYQKGRSKKVKQKRKQA